MGRLLFVGLGLWDAQDMTVRARDALAAADEVFAEFYTSRLFGAENQDLAQMIGRPYEMLSREGVEEGAERILAAASGDATVALVTAGDALTATTHQGLRHAALERGIEVGVIHGVSIKTAASGLTGLSDYKFGRTTTLVFPDERFFPESPIDVIVENRARGLHTLVLLDIQQDRGRYMTGAEGCQVLLEIMNRREERGEGVDAAVLAPSVEAFVVARAGSPEPLVVGGSLAELANGDFGGPLHCLVVPGRMTEEEAGVASAVTGHGFRAG